MGGFVSRPPSYLKAHVKLKWMPFLDSHRAHEIEMARRERGPNISMSWLTSRCAKAPTVGPANSVEKLQEILASYSLLLAFALPTLDVASFTPQLCTRLWTLSYTTSFLRPLFRLPARARYLRRRSVFQCCISTRALHSRAQPQSPYTNSSKHKPIAHAPIRTKMFGGVRTHLLPVALQPGVNLLIKKGVWRV